MASRRALAGWLVASLAVIACSIFRCDGPEDCDGGRVCCLRNENGQRTACALASQCAQAGGAAICRSGADCPSFAPSCSGTSGSMISVCR